MAGFDVNFLGRVVGSPDWSGPRFKGRVATRLSNPAEATLTYTHFSVVMHSVRRLPLFGAVNIDGGQMDHALLDAYIALHGGFYTQSAPGDRKASMPGNASGLSGAIGALDADRWQAEADIRAEFQLDNTAYKGKDNIFDRGHMVRRIDPIWGTDDERRQAERDTFRYTNCCPQHQRFNQQVWIKLERYLLEQGARKNSLKLNVFTGPVLGEHDPDDLIPGQRIPVPLAFWKVVSMLDEKGDLIAAGYYKSQADLLKQSMADTRRIRLADWEPGPVDKEDPMQRSIAELEDITGLSFGALTDADKMKKGDPPIHLGPDLSTMNI